MYFLLQGMDIIETLNPAAFTEYLKKFGNTICGRHPIGVLLQVKEYKHMLIEGYMSHYL
jgi:predicted class III extradiol MEMO1 family dioxygenase